MQPPIVEPIDPGANSTLIAQVLRESLRAGTKARFSAIMARVVLKEGRPTFKAQTCLTCEESGTHAAVKQPPEDLTVLFSMAERTGLQPRTSRILAVATQDAVFIAEAALDWPRFRRWMMIAEPQLTAHEVLRLCHDFPQEEPWFLALLDAQ
jgi:hypothetical protein